MGSMRPVFLDATPREEADVSEAPTIPVLSRVLRERDALVALVERLEMFADHKAGCPGARGEIKIYSYGSYSLDNYSAGGGGGGPTPEGAVGANGSILASHQCSCGYATCADDAAILLDRIRKGER